MDPSLDGAFRAAAERLRGQEVCRLVSHFDADGIAASAILATALERAGIATTSTFLPQLDEIALGTLPTKGFLVFLDMGSAYAPAIEQAFGDRVLVLDHRKLEGEPGGHELNPWSFGLDGGRDACSATLAFFVARALEERNENLAPLALVGVIADAQEKRGLQGLNEEAVMIGERAGLIALEERLKLFGYERKDLVRLLAASHDLRIPGVTGSTGGARRFLEGIGIPTEKDGRAVRYGDLNAEQRAALLEAGKKAATRKPTTALHFTLLKEEGMFRDARQYATLLNAFGRLERPEQGVAVCRGNASARAAAEKVLAEYRQTLHDAYAWQQRSPDVIRKDGYVLIDAGPKILASVMGTVCSMITRGGDVPPDTAVVGLADQGDAIKVSVRVAGYNKDAHELVTQMMDGIAGTSGGHAQAAGAVIRAADKGRFVENAQRILGNL